MEFICVASSVPRQLVDKSKDKRILPPRHLVSSGPLPRIRMGCQFQKVGTGVQVNLQLWWLPNNLHVWLDIPLAGGNP